MDLIFLEPVLKHYIWGGTKLREEFHYNVDGDNIGECWGVSAHKNGDCNILGMEGETLSSLWRKRPELFGKSAEETAENVFPLLIKVIDAKNNLSIQVHPDDTYAKIHENGSLGKTECWYVLDCEENAELVLGHTATTKEELQHMIAENKWEELLQKIPVKKGDFFQIDPGTVHAIGGGITLLETQQNSDITYRLYDYGRLQNGLPRELHIEKSVDVITVPAVSGASCIIDTNGKPVNALNLLYDCPYYKVFALQVEGKATIQKEYPYMMMSVVEGEGEINGVSIQKGEHFILTTELEIAEFVGNMTLVASVE
ncbi:type I phosphomannose isomerase catalytic subunit [Chakrabartyella piscis]|uniref:type I phosphomannose isomerase catalytic subunit n=1 Tax=Chakrabartyella piscis TaxID=2918914 RepID=UPI00295859C5|nr:type I phosphomannose isomerase catalytic subunit [Chakrabartyella piscis]